MPPAGAAAVACLGLVLLLWAGLPGGGLAALGLHNSSGRPSPTARVLRRGGSRPPTPTAAALDGDNSPPMAATAAALHSGNTPPSTDPLEHDQDLANLLSLLELRRHLTEPANLMPVIVNPYTPYFLCDHHVGGEDDGFGEHPPRADIVLHPLDARKAAGVQPCDIVCVDAVAFKGFAADILPALPARVILFTHRWRLPAVQRSNVTDAVRTNEKVFHWFAQNPVYPADDRYSPFPYGVRSQMLGVLAEAMLAYYRSPAAAAAGSGATALEKNQTLEHPHMTPTHPSRKRLIARRSGQGTTERMRAPDYYARLGQSEFLISPRGDRPDTYRHWEAIAMGAIPIANIEADLFGPLFGEDMVYVNDTDAMLAFLDRPATLEGRYHRPRSGRVSTLPWVRQVDAVRAACRAGGGG